MQLFVTMVSKAETDQLFQEFQAGKTPDYEGVLKPAVERQQKADFAKWSNAASVLLHLTASRHMCYKRQFVYETCLRWQKPEALKDRNTCSEARILLTACQAELHAKVKRDCPKQFDALVKCLDANHGDAGKCKAALLPFDRCTEDYMPGTPGTFF